MKKILFFLLIFIGFQSLYAQLATFDWRIHVSYTKPSAIASDGNRVLCSFKNGILAYDVEDNEIETWSYANYLSDVEISYVSYDKLSKSFWIGYNNGNIDVLKGNTITNIPYLKLANTIGSKKINSFTANGNFVYAVADFGILMIDPNKNEIRETFYTNQNGNRNLQLAFLNDSIYTLTPNNVYVAAANNPILTDYGQWQSIPSLTLDSSSTYNSMVVWNNQLVLGRTKDNNEAVPLTFYNNGVIPSPIQQEFELANLTVIEDNLYVSERYGISIFDKNYAHLENFFQYEFGGIPSTVGVVKNKDRFYLADNDYGLVKFRNNWDNQKLTPQGPADSRFYHAKGKKGKMLFSAGVINKYGPAYSRTGSYILDNEEWTFFGHKNRPELKNDVLWDFNSADVHPKDAKKIAIAGAGQEYCLFLLEDGEITAKYGLSNSILEHFLDNDSLVCITDVQYDKKGNLWMLNAFGNYPLKVLTADGLFYQFNTGSSTRRTYVDKLRIDEKGNPWFVIDGKGICGYFTNGTIEDASDDNFKILNTGDFSGALPSNDVTDILVTKDGKFWIVTAEGFSILNNPPSVQDATSGNYNTYRPKVQFGENTEYFFGETYITCGIVDGGNRKWVGTMDAGLYCLAEDGYSIIHQFDKNNSRLISNTILDLALNDKTGELFVVTELGLESIRIDASEGSADYKDVIVFPNPVTPEYSGVVTIQGIKTDSDVKITDVAGNLVYRTTSNGGTAVWDGKKVNGDEVASGVYLIWTAPKKGKGHKVGSVTVIR